MAAIQDKLIKTAVEKSCSLIAKNLEAHSCSVYLYIWGNKLQI